MPFPSRNTGGYRAARRALPSQYVLPCRRGADPCDGSAPPCWRRTGTKRIASPYLRPSVPGCFANHIMPQRSVAGSFLHTQDRFRRRPRKAQRRSCRFFFAEIPGDIAECKPDCRLGSRDDCTRAQKLRATYLASRMHVNRVWFAPQRDRARTR